MYDVTPSLNYQLHERMDSPIHTKWDPRWVHLFVKLDEEELVCRFAGESDPKVTSYLVKSVRNDLTFIQIRQRLS